MHNEFITVKKQYFFIEIDNGTQFTCLYQMMHTYSNLYNW